MIKKQFKSFLSFSKKELNGLLVFSILLLLVYFSPRLYLWANPPKQYSFTAFKNEIAHFKASEKLRRTYSYKQLRDEAEEKELKPEYFEFDPNGLSASAWQRLGLSAKQIKVIKNFENKGGHFYKKEDLERIYSITDDDYARLEPYIRIAAKPFEKKFDNPKPKYERASKPVVLVELNSADSAQLETVNGIGPAFASRILKYRTRLGGFHSKAQLMEVFGLDSAKYQALESQVEVDVRTVQKIDINTAVFDDLKRHPYLSYKQMNAIVQYRKQHGNYNNLSDLSKIAILNSETLRKLSPYLTF